MARDVPVSCDAPVDRVDAPDDLIVVGQLTAPYGVRGWVRIHSDTEPADNIFSYQPLYLRRGEDWQPIEFDQSRRHGKGLVGHPVGSETRDQALSLCRRELACSAAQLPRLGDDEYYWHDLEGMQVVSRWQEREARLGEIVRLFATGANDVMVVQGADGSLDRRERLIPWLPGDTVLEVDRVKRRVLVEWDPSF